MKSKIVFFIALAVLAAGVFYYRYDRESSKLSEIPFFKKESEKIEEPLKSIVLKILAQFEKEQIVRVQKNKEEIIIETENSQIEKLLNENPIAKENNIKAIRSKEIVLFQKDNETLSVKINLQSKGLLTEKPKLAIVIDDIGYSKELGEELFKIKGLTYSILPDLPYSRYFAELANENNKEIMLHIPLEPRDADKYGKSENLITTAMSDAEISKKIEKFISSVPNIKGVNNHMGSKFTENEIKMRVLLEKIKGRNLFFLDSRTSAQSVAYNVAKDMGIKSYKRDIFLDHEVNEEKIREQLLKALDDAMNKGYAVAIGHPHKETIKVLKEMLPEIESKVELVTLSSLKVN